MSRALVLDVVESKKLAVHDGRQARSEGGKDPTNPLAHDGEDWPTSERWTLEMTTWQQYLGVAPSGCRIPSSTLQPCCVCAGAARGPS